jgi:hypothetical protein
LVKLSMRRPLVTLFAFVLVAGVAAAYPPATIQDATQNSITIGGLECGTQYRLQVEENRGGAWLDARTYTQATADCPEPPPPPPPPSDGRVGAATVGTGTDSNPTGLAQDYRTTGAVTGQVDRLNVYLDGANTATTVELGLYASQSSTTAGARLGRCVITGAQANAWNRCTIAAVNVAQGTTYWLAVLKPTDASGTIRYRNTTGTGQTFVSQSGTLAQLPATWSNGTNYGAQTASIYADKQPAAPPLPDGDGDGFPDASDLCPNQAGAAPDGCPAPLPGGELQHDTSYEGPAYYARWSNGPPTSQDHFPILAYHMNLGQWSGLPARLTGMGINGIYMGYDASNQQNFDIAAANGLNVYLHGSIGARSNSQVADAYTMQDEPNADGTSYGPKVGPPYVGADRYVADANARRQSDPSRPIIGNFTKDIASWAWTPSGWTTAQWQEHRRRQVNALDITSMDIYGWTDPWEWSQGDGFGTRHVAAWAYGHGIDRLEQINPNAPAYGFVECCADGNNPPGNTMMPGMIESAVWNMLAHGARGFTYWPRDFYHADDEPYAGATFTGEYSMFGDHQWDAQYDRAKAVNARIKANARKLNAPTVTGISATGQNGVPVTALGKDDGGKLWLLAVADGNEAHPLSNTTPMQGTIQLPAAVAPGTVFDVLGEGRTVTVNASRQIVDTFGTTTETPTYDGRPLTYGYAEHIYQQR